MTGKRYTTEDKSRILLQADGRPNGHLGRERPNRNISSMWVSLEENNSETRSDHLLSGETVEIECCLRNISFSRPAVSTSTSLSIW